MLDNYLQPLQLSKVIDFSDLEDFQLGNQIVRFEGEFPDLENTQIALIGASAKEASAVRKHLYQLTEIAPSIAIADLGNLMKPRIEVLTPVLEELLNRDILPIIIGEQHQLTLGQYRAYELREKLSNLVLIDKTLDFTFDKARARRHRYFINKIFQREESYLLHLGLLGYQTHFINRRTLKLLDEHYFDFFRLGYLRTHFEEVEPIIRDADLLSFDLSAIRQAEAPASLAPSPSGLTVEEACKLSYYAGISDKLTSIGFYGFQQKQDNEDQTSHLVAQMIWYFLDGVAHRKRDYPISSLGLVEYVVDFKSSDYAVVFWKSTRSDRWWVQLPLNNQQRKQLDHRHQLIPCAYADYQLACKGELSERVVRAFGRIG